MVKERLGRTHRGSDGPVKAVEFGWRCSLQFWTSFGLVPDKGGTYRVDVEFASCL